MLMNLDWHAVNGDSDRVLDPPATLACKLGTHSYATCGGEADHLARERGGGHPKQKHLLVRCHGNLAKLLNIAARTVFPWKSYGWKQVRSTKEWEGQEATQLVTIPHNSLTSEHDGWTQ